MSTSVGSAHITIYPEMAPGFGAGVKAATIAETEAVGVGQALSNSIGSRFKSSLGQIMSGGGGLGSMLKGVIGDTTAGVAESSGAMGAAAGLAFGAAVVLAVGVGLFKLGEEIQGAFDQVEIGTGATGSALEKLDADVMKIISTTQVSIGDASTAITGYVQRLGDASPELVRVSALTTELAKLTGSSLGPLVASIAADYQQWGMADDGAAQLHFQEQLYRAWQKSGVSVATLADEMRTAAPMFKNLGMDSTEALATLAQWGKEGVNVSAALRGMKIAYAELTVIRTGQKTTDQDLLDAEKALADANNAVADATNAVTTATTDLGKARDVLASLENGGIQLQRDQALQREVNATQSLVEAKQRQADAEQALSALQSGGLAAETAQAQDNIANAVGQLADATDRALKAQQALTDLMKGPTAQDQAKAALSVTEAQNAITQATMDRTKAETDLRDARALGDAGLIAKAQQAVADASAGQTSAQLSLNDALQAQTDLQPDSVKSMEKVQAAQDALSKANDEAAAAAEAKFKADAAAVALVATQAREIRDARQLVVDTTNAEKDAELSLRTQRANDTASLGADLSGAQQIKDAHDKITKAAQGVTDAEAKVKDAQDKLAQTDNPVNGMARIKDILDKAGLSAADSKTQYAYLINYIATSPDNIAAQTAIDLFGKKAGPDLVQNIKLGAFAITGPGGMDEALRNVGKTIDNTYDKTDRVSRAWQDFKNNLSIALEVPATTLVGGAADILSMNKPDSAKSWIANSIVLTPVGAGLKWIFGKAGGDPDWMGGPVLVGEKGPEIANLPPHTQIFPADMSAKMMNSATLGQQTSQRTVNANFYAPPARPLDETEIARQLVRLQRLG